MSTETPSALQEEVPRDEEGLRKHYDVILCGTGLVQSILASALARAGLSVLHCDAADYYGELDAVWTFSFLKSLQERQEKEEVIIDEPALEEGWMRMQKSSSVQFHSMESKAIFPVEMGTTVSTPYGIGKVSRLNGSLSVDLVNWTLANGRHPQVHIGSLPAENTTEYLQKHHKIEALITTRARMILQERSRSLALDVTPRLVYAAGSGVQSLLTSKVADYLEWKALEGLVYLNSDTHKLEPVPCNKNDVFSSKLLTPMDKRRLMKFLQLAMDYGTAQEAEEEGIQSLNERHLNQGRSLARPQNKQVASGDMKVLQECIAAGMNFETYLEEKHRLSQKLRALVRYALALESGDSDTLLEDGMNALCAHMASLGRFGSTAFLVPLYGSGEMPQAFCRSAAVYGATYLLRRTPRAIVTNDSRVTGVVLEVSNDEDEETTKHAATKTVSCSHVVAPSTSVVPSEDEKRVLRRISVLSGKPIGSGQDQQRHVVIIPPNTLDNPAAIHGLLLDEGVNVAPHVPGGSTIVHLTTTIPAQGSVDDSMLRRALDTILAGSQKPVEEVFHASFSYPLSNNVQNDANTSNVQGLHTVRRLTPGVEADPAFDQAADIFRKICPALDFLTMSKAMDEAVKERAGNAHQEDEDNMVLESAMGMIQQEVASCRKSVATEGNNVL